MKKYVGNEADYLICNQTIKGCDDIENVKKALRYALDVINSYEIDIRNSEWLTGQYEPTLNLIELGFCQGRIYKQVYNDIVNRLQK